jgi:hypothetical protein
MERKIKPYDVPVGEPLIPRKKKIADLIENSDLPEDLFRPQGDKWTAIHFIRVGSPSEYYLNQCLDKLKQSGIDTSSVYESRVLNFKNFYLR